jgi:antitoxin VapB|tara:strand:- start:402 stop:650 length:249 start_codon:yes stop_codon:yes gene_type:complete
MAMLIKGDEIDDLVAKYCALTGVRNKSEAVRQALAAQISALSQKESLADRVASIQNRAAAFGIVADSADDKAFMDAMWGDEA